MSFKHKVVLITGASGGIGAAAAIEFCKEEAFVVIVGRNEAKLKNVKEKCEQYGSTPLVIKADVSVDADVKRIIAETIEKYGKIDVLVNNAGTLESVDITSKDFMEVYDYINNVNLRGAVYIAHLAIPYLIKSKGNIINVSSICGIRTWSLPNIIPYSVSKAGLSHFTRCTAMNLASYGVRVNTISPGPVRTDIFDRQSLESVTWKNLEQMTAFKRVSESDEIAELLLFLASDKARSITGSNFVSDNGAIIMS